jgi:hypothetical protein
LSPDFQKVFKKLKLLISHELKNGCSGPLLLCLFYQSLFPELLKFTACIPTEIMISKYCSRAVMYKSGSWEGLSVETTAIEGKYHIFQLNFQHAFDE